MGEVKKKLGKKKRVKKTNFAHSVIKRGNRALGGREKQADYTPSLSSAAQYVGSLESFYFS